MQGEAKTGLDLPKRTRKYQSHHFESSHWDDYKPRDGDIIICTSYKSGTTWIQNLIFNLLFQEPNKEDVKKCHEFSPWVDFRVPPDGKARMERIEKQKHRRILKTHLPLDALPYYENVQYVYVSRSGLDIFMSLVNHYSHGNKFFYEMLNDTPNRVGPKLPNYAEEYKGDLHAFYKDWVSKGWPAHPHESQGYPFWSVLHGIHSFWKYRHCPKIFFVHYNNMLNDLEGEARKLCKFLEIDVSDEKFFQRAMDRCTFKWMKERADLVTPLGAFFLEGGGNTFIYKGTNGRWKGVLSDEEVAMWHARLKELPEDCAKFMETGIMPD